MDDVRTVIRENIKKLCIAKSVKQKELAAYLGVSASSVTNWMKGTNSIDIENLAKLCEYLNVTLNQIYGLESLGDSDTLDCDELALISAYRGVNDDGKREIQRHAKYVAAQEEYQPIIEKRKAT